MQVIQFISVVVNFFLFFICTPLYIFLLGFHFSQVMYSFYLNSGAKFIYNCLPVIEHIFWSLKVGQELYLPEEDKVEAEMDTGIMIDLEARKRSHIHFLL